MSTDLIESLLARGVDIDLFTTDPPDAIAERVSRFPNLSTRHFKIKWEWRRWYSRNPFSSFLTGTLARMRTYKEIARAVIAAHAERPFDCVFQISQTELFDLGRNRDKLPPIVIYPCVHAAGELRWHRREGRYARQSESPAIHYVTRAVLLLRTKIQRRELRKPATIIGMSRRFNELLAQDYGVPPAKQAVLYHPIRKAGGVDGTAPIDAHVRPRDGVVRIVYVARISVRKGLDMVVDLSRRLDDLRGQVTIEVVGGRTLWSNYTGHLKELNSNVAKYVGELAHDAVAEKLATADMLVLPSRYEPGGLVVGEALAQGTPVVVSEEVGSAEQVADLCCRRFKDGDGAAFEAAVRQLIVDLRTDEANIRATAAAEARKYFTLRKIGGDLQQILERTVSGRAGQA